MPVHNLHGGSRRIFIKRYKKGEGKSLARVSVKN